MYKVLTPFLVVTLLSLSACGPLSTLGKVAGLSNDGPTANVNAQIGKENTQQAVANQTNKSISTGRDSTVTTTDNNQKITADRVDTVVVNEVPAWVVLLLVLGWFLPSPGELGRWLTGLFKRKK